MSRRSRWSATLVASLVLVLGAVAPARAADAPAARACTITWTAPGGGGWTTPTNWSPARVPTAEDDVCLSPSPVRRQIRLVRSAVVHSVRVGDSTIAIAATRTLMTTLAFLDGRGGVAGPGQLDTRNLTVPARRGPAVLSGGAVLLASQTVSLLGPLRLAGGSTLRANTLAYAAPITDDGDPANLVDVTTLSVAGQSSLDVPLRVRFMQLHEVTFAVPRLLGLDASGTYSAPGNITVDHATLVLPYPVVTIGPDSSLQLFPGSSIIAASTGGPALTGLQTLEGSLVVATSTTLGAALSVHGGFLAVGDPDEPMTLSVPSLDADSGSEIELGIASTLALGGGAGALTLNGTGPLLEMEDAVIVGDVNEGDGRVFVNPASLRASEIHGNLTSSSAAVLTLSQNQRPPTAGPPSNLLVRGTANLAGSINYLASGDRPPVGTRDVLLTATGGLTSALVDLGQNSPGWRFTSNARSLVATYTGRTPD